MQNLYHRRARDLVRNILQLGCRSDLLAGEYYVSGRGVRIGGHHADIIPQNTCVSFEMGLKLGKDCIKQLRIKTTQIVGQIKADVTRGKEGDRCQ